MHYKYIIKPLALRKILSFYRNVSLKYPNTFTYYDRLKLINKTVDAILFIL